VSRHWKPDSSTRWLSPEAYAALSPAERQRLWRERKLVRHDRFTRRRSQRSMGLGPWLAAAVAAGLAIGIYGVPSPNLAHPASAPVRASFSYCYSGGGTNCVVDGDTFWIGGEKVRIAGIDAPETHPPRCDYEAQLGNEATEKLHALLNSGAVTMTSIDRDRDVYGRLLRDVQVNGTDVGEAMVSAGVAREWVGHREPWC
jgi:endonuclease YncB( thermonuclease family)